MSVLLCIALTVSVLGCSANNTSTYPDASSDSSQSGVSDAISAENSTDSTQSSETVSESADESSSVNSESTADSSSGDPQSKDESESTDKPAAVTDSPASTTAKPSSTTAKPSSTTAKPASTTAKPASTTAKPASTTVKPADNTPAKMETTVYEAENAVLSRDLSVVSVSGSSGGKAVEKFENNSSYAEFTVTVPAGGLYDIAVYSSGIGSDKENNVLADGEQVGTFKSTNGTLGKYTLTGISLSEGTHKIKITKSWGWIQLDKIEVSSSKGIDDSVYNVSAELVNKNATAEAKSLYKYLCDSYGSVILSGQVCDGGYSGKEFKAIYGETGKYPAILGLDMMDYTPSRTALGAGSTAVDKAIAFDKKGGIVTFCWHWNAPTSYLKSGSDPDTGNPRWWGGFYTRNSDFDIAKVMNGSDSEGKKLLDADIKEIAAQLKKLENAGVPVIWRPLHEASGGWFWWGAKGADAYKKLWVYLYEQLTYTYKCNNLIWVFNGQSADWYPGDEYVDIIGEDIYPGQKVYAPQSAKFTEALEYSGANKIVALTENGCIFDIDRAVETNTMWAWFCTWGGEFAVNGSSYSEKYTEKSILKKAYASKYVITLDELPNLKNYS